MDLFLYTSKDCPACPSTKAAIEKVAKTHDLTLQTKRIENLSETEVNKLNLQTVPTLDIVDAVKGEVKRLTGKEINSWQNVKLLS